MGMLIGHVEAHPSHLQVVDVDGKEIELVLKEVKGFPLDSFYLLQDGSNTALFDPKKQGTIAYFKKKDFPGVARVLNGYAVSKDGRHLVKTRRRRLIDRLLEAETCGSCVTVMSCL